MVRFINNAPRARTPHIAALRAGQFPGRGQNALAQKTGQQHVIRQGETGQARRQKQALHPVGDVIVVKPIFGYAVHGQTFIHHFASVRHNVGAV